MAPRLIKSKWTKKEKAFFQDLMLHEAPEESLLFFCPDSIEYSWRVQLIRSPKELADITKAVACLLNRPLMDGFFRGVTYDSPQTISEDLQRTLGYLKPYVLGTHICL